MLRFAAAFAAIGALFGPAAAQEGEAAQRAAVLTRCGSHISSLVKTQIAQSSAQSTFFATVPGAVLSFSVPAGQTRCIKVLFTAQASCRATGANDTCFIRATDNGAELHPHGQGEQIFVTEDSTPGGHAYEWVGRVGAGSHTVRIERRVQAPATTFVLDNWTFDLSVHR
jgi:hypothetical protein